MTAHSVLKIKKEHTLAQLPTKGHDDDAGWDLYTCADVIIQPGYWEDIPIGISIEPPPGIWFRIVGRSSTFRKRRLLVIEGIIDAGYRGELFVGCWNAGSEPAHIEVGERLCQMLPQYNMLHFSPEWADRLAMSVRGTGGFGSTGS